MSVPGQSRQNLNGHESPSGNPGGGALAVLGFTVFGAVAIVGGLVWGAFSLLASSDDETSPQQVAQDDSSSASSLAGAAPQTNAGVGAVADVSAAGGAASSRPRVMVMADRAVGTPDRPVDDSTKSTGNALRYHWEPGEVHTYELYLNTSPDSEKDAVTGKVELTVEETPA